MGGGKGGGGSTTTVQKADPWEGQQPYLTGGTVGASTTKTPKYDADGNRVGYTINTTSGTTVPGVFSEAAKLYMNGQLAPDYYPWQTVANQSQWTQDALQMQAYRAQNGSPLINNASNSINNITTGQALAGNQGLNTLNQLAGEDNPYTDELFNRANSQVQASLDSNFNRAGRYGSGAHEAAAADAANNLANEMYSGLWDKRAQAASSAGQLYNTGIGQQVLASHAGQQLANQAYTDAAALGQAGAAMDDYNQQKINADIDRYNYDQQKALLALQNYNNLIQGSYGGTSTTTGQQSSSGSRLGNVAGGALTGGGLAYMLGASNPIIGASALAGGLLGLF